MKRAPRLSFEASLVLAAFCAFYLWIFLGILQPLQDPDLWWHLASGRDIFLHRRIPFVDVFSRTAAGTRWVNSYWLYDVIAFLIYAHLGFNRLNIAHAFLVLGVFYFADRRLKENNVHWVLRLAALTALYVGGAPSGGYWGPQASLITLFSVSALLWHLDRWKRRGWNQALWLWVPYFILWANLHRGFLLGLVIAGAYVLQDQEPGNRRRAWLWLAACAGATCLNPFFFGVFHMIWDDISFSSEQVTGWLPPSLEHDHVFVWTIPLFWVLSLRKPKELLHRWPLTAWAALLTLGSLRHLVYVSYFMLYAVPAIAIQLSPLFERAPWTVGLKRVEKFAAVVLFGIFLVGIREIRPELGMYWPRVFDFIQAENINGPFYNDYVFGGQWMWAFAGDPPVFIDGRYPAVEGYKPLAREIVAATAGPHAWSQFLEKYRIEAALVKYYEDTPRHLVHEAIFPRSRWALVFWDDWGALYLRRHGRNEKVIATQQFLEVWPDAEPADMIRQLDLLSPAARQRLGAELARNRALHPRSRRTAEMFELLLARRRAGGPSPKAP